MFHVFGRTTVGYRKLRAGQPSEDAYKIVRFKKVAICAVADGHGDSKCKFSAIGASFAAETACEVLRAAFQSCPDERALYEFCANNRENFQLQILCKWREKVFLDYLQRTEDINAALMKEDMLAHINALLSSEPKVMTAKEARELFSRQHLMDEMLSKIMLLYGTTLNVVLNTESFVLCLGLGDGDVVCVQEKRVEWLLPPSEQFSTKTASLCWSSNRALEAFRSVIIQKKGSGTRHNKLLDTNFAPDFILVSTDGLRNSFVSDDRFMDKLIDIADEKAKGFKKFQSNSQTWIEQLTKDSLYQDDITCILLATK